MRAAGSWRPGIGAFMPPPWPCWRHRAGRLILESSSRSTLLVERKPVSTFRDHALPIRRFGSGVDRRSGHEGVEGGERLHPEPILLHQQLMAAARHDEMGAGPQPDGKFVDRRRRDDLVVAGGDDQYGLADSGRKARLREVSDRL